MTSPTDNEFATAVIATLHSPFKQKFAIPRQPNLVREARGQLVFHPPCNDPNMLRGLEQFTHLWLLFRFHATAEQGWSPTVQPPRLGGKERVGVFACRSPFRPNPIGLSVVENLGVESIAGELILHVGGIDLLDQTPVIDIKPYLPYADAIVDAKAGFAQDAPGAANRIHYSEQATQALAENADRLPDLEAFITSLLQQDPRPAWRAKPSDDKQYGMALYDLNIKWRIESNCIEIVSIQPLAE